MSQHITRYILASYLLFSPIVRIAQSTRALFFFRITLVGTRHLASCNLTQLIAITTHT